jgi:hypothetical protein
MKTVIIKEDDKIIDEFEFSENMEDYVREIIVATELKEKDFIVIFKLCLERGILNYLNELNQDEEDGYYDDYDYIYSGYFDDLD